MAKLNCREFIIFPENEQSNYTSDRRAGIIEQCVLHLQIISSPKAHLRQGTFEKPRVEPDEPLSSTSEFVPNPLSHVH